MVIPLVLLGMAAASDADLNRLTEVQGHTYRVIVKDRIATVFDGHVASRVTLDDRDRQREAVRLVTGCDPVDEYASIGRLDAKLSCPAKAP